ncbi:hypothetical protein QQF64_016393 [Cirrhinus molitorella]|uniref:Uncharacterized protein n=1 Tax=Cirrhinus molitorella TaxID=172907 RepID=A0ABR3LMM9_9TELE
MMILEHHSHVSSITLHYSSSARQHPAHESALLYPYESANKQILEGLFAVRATANISFKICVLDVKVANLSHVETQKAYENAKRIHIHTST